MGKAFSQTVSTVFAPLVASLAQGRLQITATCDGCEDTVSWPGPRMVTMKGMVKNSMARGWQSDATKKAQARGWHIDFSRKEQKCPTCQANEHARRYEEQNPAPVADPPVVAQDPPTPTTPKRNFALPTATMTIVDQIMYLIKEQPGISSREIAAFFPDKRPDFISSQLWSLYSKGNLRREQEVTPREGKGGSNFMFRYWYELGAKPEPRVLKKDQPKFAGPVSNEPFRSPPVQEPKSMSHLPASPKSLLLAGTMIEGTSMVAASEETPAPKPQVTDTARAAKRRAYELLLDNYDTDKKRYKGDWSDKVIAAQTGYAEAAVAKLREEDFGPAGPPPQLLNMKDALTKLEARIAAVESKIAGEMDELSTLQGTAAALRRDLDRLAEAHGWEKE